MSSRILIQQVNRVDVLPNLHDELTISVSYDPQKIDDVEVRGYQGLMNLLCK